MKLKFEGSYLKQEDKAAFPQKNEVHFFFVYELNSWPWDLNTDFTLRDCLLEGAKLSKNSDPDKCSYSGYGTGFDTQIEYPLPDGSVGKNNYNFWSWYELISAYWSMIFRSMVE